MKLNLKLIHLKKCLLEGLDDIALSLEKLIKSCRLKINLKIQNPGYLMIKVKRKFYFYLEMVSAQRLLMKLKK